MKLQVPSSLSAASASLHQVSQLLQERYVPIPLFRAGDLMSGVDWKSKKTSMETASGLQSYFANHDA
jgi:hypothetical protein